MLGIVLCNKNRNIVKKQGRTAYDVEMSDSYRIIASGKNCIAHTSSPFKSNKHADIFIKPNNAKICVKACTNKILISHCILIFNIIISFFKHCDINSSVPVFAPE